MKYYIIQTRRGYFTLPERIVGFNFPKSIDANFYNATRFSFRSAAQKMIKKYKLENSQIEEFNYE